MIGYSVEEIREKVKKIAAETEDMGRQVENGKAQMLINRGKMEELSNLHNLILEQQQKEDEDEEEAEDEG